MRSNATSQRASHPAQVPSARITVCYTSNFHHEQNLGAKVDGIIHEFIFIIVWYTEAGAKRCSNVVARLISFQSCDNSDDVLMGSSKHMSSSVMKCLLAFLSVKLPVSNQGVFFGFDTPERERDSALEIR